MGKWTTIAEAAIEVLAKRKGGALPDTTLPIRPARENLRTVIDSNTIGGRVSGDEMVPIDSLSGGPSLSARGQKAVDDIVEQMSGPDGFIERLIVDQDNNVIEGAHRVEALRRLGIEQVPITRVVDPTANLDLPKMGEAIKAVGPIHSDHVNQITAQVGDMLAEVGGDPAKVLQEFDLPKGFERFFRAALDSVSPKTLPTDEASRMARGYSGEANTTLAISRQMPDDQATKLIKSRIGQITRDAKLRGAPPSGPYAIEIGALRNRLREIKAGAALSQQDGFDYGALGSVAEGSNGQLARRGD
jgi:hypothetical protein